MLMGVCIFCCCSCWKGDLYYDSCVCVLPFCYRKALFITFLLKVNYFIKNEGGTSNLKLYQSPGLLVLPASPSDSEEDPVRRIGSEGCGMRVE